VLSKTVKATKVARGTQDPNNKDNEMMVEEDE